MENIEKPLTWVLAIALLGYLFIANCECGEGASCEDKETIEMFEMMIEDIDTQGDIDTVIKIDLTEEAKK